uniref:Uncharacterized protein n=2 Tax=Emiliania huxleyi TaxID=2903 RepID=A0A0D3KI44_EMIH1
EGGHNSWSCTPSSRYSAAGSCPLLTRAMSTVDSEPHSKPAAESRSRDTRAMSAPSRGASAAVPARP